MREFARIRLTFRNPIHAVRVYTFFHAIQSGRWIKNKEDCLHRCQRLKTFFTYRKWKRLSTGHFGIFGSEDNGRPITRTSPEENIFFLYTAVYATVRAAVQTSDSSAHSHWRSTRQCACPSVLLLLSPWQAGRKGELWIMKLDYEFGNSLSPILSLRCSREYWEERILIFLK